MMQGVEYLTLYKLISLKAYFCLKLRPKDNKKGCIKKSHSSKFHGSKFLGSRFRVPGSVFRVLYYVLTTFMLAIKIECDWY